MFERCNEGVASPRRVLGIKDAGMVVLAMLMSEAGQIGCAVSPPPQQTPGPYGDGSAGAVTLNTTVSNLPADTNFEFTDLTIAPATTIGVSSGTVIRCTGNFTNNGTLNVITGAGGGFTDDAAVDGDTLTFIYQPPHPGWSPRLPTNGEVAANFGKATGGLGGSAIPPGGAVQLLQPGIYGGGGGANSTIGAGGSGGGALVVLVQGTFTNNGSIQANGGSGIHSSGGGGGGIIIIASKTAIDNGAGRLIAQGGASADVFNSSAAIEGSGGAGGGGIVHLLAPAITQGIIDVGGGPSGAVSATPLSAPIHRAGAGGGGCGGQGGSGGLVPAGNPALPERGSNGQPGQVIITERDPTFLF
jgi:hypothetical protein